jgi:hypothetical protein
LKLASFFQRLQVAQGRIRRLAQRLRRGTAGVVGLQE